MGSKKKKKKKKTNEDRTFVWHLRKIIYAHAPFRILRKFFLLCFGHLFGVLVCNICHSSLWQTVRPSVCPSVPAFASTFHHRLPWYFIRWLETPTACGSQISEVIWQISRSHRPTKPSETGQIQSFRVFYGERMGERPEIPYAAVSWPPDYILITVCWFYWFW